MVFVGRATESEAPEFEEQALPEDHEDDRQAAPRKTDPDRGEHRAQLGDPLREVPAHQECIRRSSTQLDRDAARALLGERQEHPRGLARTTGVDERDGECVLDRLALRRRWSPRRARACPPIEAPPPGRTPATRSPALLPHDRAWPPVALRRHRPSAPRGARRPARRPPRRPPRTRARGARANCASRRRRGRGVTDSRRRSWYASTRLRPPAPETLTMFAPSRRSHQ